MSPRLLPALLLLGCSAAFTAKDTGAGGSDGGGGADGGGADGGDGGDGGGDPSGTGDPADYGLSPLTQGIDTGGCDGFDGVDIPGAAAYFYGQYVPDGEGGWRGEERWLLFANPTWQDAGFDDCEVVWITRASETATGACGACDLGIAVSASVDQGRTTCPEELWEDPADKNWSAEYAVAISGDDSVWYFASGSPLGEGSHADGAMNFLSEKTCQFF
jgi:hypothetical protein